jgi:hypothetical protein
MAAVDIPVALREKLGPEMKMDTHWVDVKLHDGRVFKNLVVQGSRYVTGRDSDPNGEGVLPFTGDDIKKLRRHSILPFWW